VAQRAELWLWVQFQPASNVSLEQHRAGIREFLAMVDPATGYIEDS
jgi:hypothetical protein